MQTTTKTDVLGRLAKRLKPALESAAAEPAVTEEMYAGLPPGINGGIAELRELGFRPAKNKEGESEFYAVGVAVEPEYLEVRGEDGKVTQKKVRGGQTRPFGTPLYDTPERKNKEGEEMTLDANVKEMTNTVKNLLGPAEFDHSNEEDRAKLYYDNIRDTFADMMDPNRAGGRIFFHFRTWQGEALEPRLVKGKWWVVGVKSGTQKRGPYDSEEALRNAKNNKNIDREPFINHVWGGRVSDYVPVEADGLEDGTAAPGKASSNGHAGSAVMPRPGGKPSVQQMRKVAQDAEQPDAGAGDDEDLDALAEEAKTSAGAEERLKDLAVAAGVKAGKPNDKDKTTFYGADSYEDVVQMIRDLRAENEGDAAQQGDDEPTPETPEVEQVWRYHQIGADKKPAKRATDCEVVSVDEDAQTVTLKAPPGKSGKVLKDAKGKVLNVSWASLVSAT